MTSVRLFMAWVRFCGTEDQNRTSNRYNMYACYSEKILSAM